MDPFSLFHQEVLDRLTSDITVLAAVPEENFIDLQANENPKNKALGEADYPYVWLQPTEAEYNLKGTSTHSVISQRYALQLSTNRSRSYNELSDYADRYVLPVRWAIARVIFDMVGDLTLTDDDGNSYKYIVDLENSNEAIKNNKGTRGWYTELFIVATLYHPRSSM